MIPAGSTKFSVYAYGTPGPGGEVSCPEVYANSVPWPGGRLTGLTHNGTFSAVSPMLLGPPPGRRGAPRTTVSVDATLTAGRVVIMVTLLVAAAALVCTVVIPETVNCASTSIRAAMMRPRLENCANIPTAQ